MQTGPDHSSTIVTDCTAFWVHLFRFVPAPSLSTEEFAEQNSGRTAMYHLTKQNTAPPSASKFNSIHACSWHVLGRGGVVQQRSRDTVGSLQNSDIDPCTCAAPRTHLANLGKILCGHGLLWACSFTLQRGVQTELTRLHLPRHKSKYSTSKPKHLIEHRFLFFTFFGAQWRGAEARQRKQGNKLIVHTRSTTVFRVGTGRKLL